MRGFAAGLALVFVLSACRDNGAPDRTAEEGDDVPKQGLAFDDVQTVVGGLDVPWDIAFVDERTILVTEPVSAPPRHPPAIAAMASQSTSDRNGGPAIASHEAALVR